MSIPLILTSPGGTGGSATPGGISGDIQFNNAGALGGETLVPLANGGTAADLSASGGTTAVLAQDASHVITARNLVAADVPNLDAAKVTTGQIALARGGTNADLSATGGASKFLKQASLGAAVTVAQPAFTDVSGTIAAAQIAAASIDLTAKVTGVLPVANGGTAQVATAGQGYLVGGMIPLLSSLVGSIAVGTINHVRCFQFVLPYSIKISKVRLRVSTVATSALVSSGIYSADGTTKLVDSGTFDGSTGTTLKTNAITPVTLNPGVYWFAWTANNITVQLASQTSSVSGGEIIGGTPVWGEAANASSAGVLPASLGAVSGLSLSAFNTPYVLFEP